MYIHMLAILLYVQLFAAATPEPATHCVSPERFALTSIDAILQDSARSQPWATGLIFQSADGGQSWQDISKGLPSQLQAEAFFAGDAGLYIGVESAMYRSSASKAPVWEKEMLPDEQGITWKQVSEQSWRTTRVESGGVVLCTSQSGIMRSTDGGKNWEVVISEGGVGIVVERIEGGFAAITYNAASKTRRIRTSADGKTWQRIDAGLPPSALIASIKQVGEYFYCGHPEGIFRSSNRGKTWERILPSIGDKVFNLSVWGNVMYAVPRAGGC